VTAAPLGGRRSLRAGGAAGAFGAARATALVLGALVLVPLAVAPAPVRALELGDQTWFASPPWKVVFRSYSSTVGDLGAEYYFTVALPAAAGVGLAGLELQQTRGVDRTFGFDVRRTRAFLGEPRREGPAIPVEGLFNEDTRVFRARFPQPPQPGQTVTLALRPWRNPFQSDTYLFAVQAFPAGPNPVPAALGFARMPIYEAFSR